MRGLRFFRLELLGGRIGSRSGHGRAGHRGCWRMLRAFQGRSSVGYGHRSASREGASCIRRQSMYRVFRLGLRRFGCNC